MSRRAHICITNCKHMYVRVSLSLVSCLVGLQFSEVPRPQTTQTHARATAKHRHLENRHSHSRGKTTSVTSTSCQRSKLSDTGFGTTGTQGSTMVRSPASCVPGRYPRETQKLGRNVDSSGKSFQFKLLSKPKITVDPK